MKHLGKKPKRCECSYCVGNGDSKAINKSHKHRARQDAKKEIKDYVLIGKPSKPSFSKAMIKKMIAK